MVQLRNKKMFRGRTEATLFRPGSCSGTCHYKKPASCSDTTLTTCLVLVQVQVLVLDLSGRTLLQFGLGTFSGPDSVHV